MTDQITRPMLDRLAAEVTRREANMYGETTPVWFVMRGKLYRRLAQLVDLSGLNILPEERMWQRCLLNGEWRSDIVALPERYLWALNVPAPLERWPRLASRSLRWVAWWRRRKSAWRLN